MVSYDPEYPGGWKDFPDETTPIIAAALQKVDDALAQLVTSVNALQSLVDAAVPNTRTVNGKPLSADVTLAASDVGAVANAGNAAKLVVLAAADPIPAGFTGVIVRKPS